MSRRRAFDWDEAARLRADGHTIRSIATRLGVSGESVMCALNPARRARARKRATAWQRGGRCPDCGTPTTRHTRTDAPRPCQRCWGLRQRHETPAERTCTTCRETKPIGGFGTEGRKDGSRRPRTICRDCESARRTANRAANREREREHERERRRRIRGAAA